MLTAIWFLSGLIAIVLIGRLIAWFYWKKIIPYEPLYPDPPRIHETLDDIVAMDELRTTGIVPGGVSYIVEQPEMLSITTKLKMKRRKGRK